MLAQPRLRCPRSSCSRQTFRKTRSLRERLSGSPASQGAPRASSWARPGRCSPLCHWVPAPTPSLQRLCLSCFPNLTLQYGNRASGRPTVRQLESGRTGIPASGAQDLRCHAGPTPNLSNSAALEGAGSFRVWRWSRTPAAQTALTRVRTRAPGCPGNPFGKEVPDHRRGLHVCFSRAAHGFI